MATVRVTLTLSGLTLRSRSSELVATESGYIALRAMATVRVTLTLSGLTLRSRSSELVATKSGYIALRAMATVRVTLTLSGHSTIQIQRTGCHIVGLHRSESDGYFESGREPMLSFSFRYSLPNEFAVF